MTMTISTSSAIWEGGLKNGKGQFSARSGAFQGAYSFQTRFEGAQGTNPEELLAAAHAACLSMALAGALEKAGHPPTRISTTASASMEKVAEGFRITRMKLEVRGQVPGIDQATFAAAAEGARQGCPVSNVFKSNIEMELEARLEN
jgi:osmotically inducible protein OsmC